ncbi:helix-turn-helix transcriptional regulator [Mesorhizobium sp.]|uniref:helix-turn-helix domain-containing protein n=1 Tax=Mesorhizobium sp. TaxID=1871066 RepID=UPI000FE4EC11|nr:helix-turn-helix transcriptional regulator [Mesorhizobium sp.]RWQ58822.1 MAG: XRE family transcriptional regulator [Mesorhizobium sp.]
MIYEYALDLRVARRKSGLSQADCAHLLGVDPSRLSKLEAGKSTPSIYELSLLCLVFNTPASTVHDRILVSMAMTLGERLASMPTCPANWLNQYNRSSTLNTLAQKLETLSQSEL